MAGTESKDVVEGQEKIVELIGDISDDFLFPTANDPSRVGAKISIKSILQSIEEDRYLTFTTYKRIDDAFITLVRSAKVWPLIPAYSEYSGDAGEISNFLRQQFLRALRYKLCGILDLFFADLLDDSFDPPKSIFSKRRFN